MSEHGCAPDIITDISIIDGLCKGRHHVVDAVKLLSDLQSYGCRPDIMTYTTVLNGLCFSERWVHAEELLAEMVHKNCPPDQVAFNTIITSLCHKGLVNRAIDVLIEYQSMDPSQTSSRTIVLLMVFATKCGNEVVRLCAILWVQA